MKPRVLLVEDNEQNSYLASYLLQAGGLEVLRATNGVQALALARDAKPDLILTDIQLPEMDGYELGRLLKAYPDLKHIPLVAATSFAMAGDRDKALAIGFDAYLEKPFDAESFLAEIRQFLPTKEGRP
jgi:two-component system cell cycle response regulator DivK